MLIFRFYVWIFWVGAMVLNTDIVSGQDYPGRPIRIFTASPGGGNDFVSRLIAQGIAGSLGQPMVVENRASVIISAELVSKAPADGYTLLVIGTPLWIGPLLDKLSYDPIRDFSPITVAGITPNVLVVHPSLPTKSVKDLIALAKARPGVINYASSITGGSIHLATELFKSMAGVKIERVNYRNQGQAVIDLIGGHVQLMFATGASVEPHIRSRRLSALAVTSAQPSALFPRLPALAASLPGYESVLIIGVFAPARTPATVISRLNQEIVRFIITSEVKEKFVNAGVEVVGSSPEQLTATMRSEMVRMGKVIKDAGIHGG